MMNVTWQKKLILRCQNVRFCYLYTAMMDEIYEKNYKFNHDLRELIEDLERCCDGWDIEISEYIYTHEDFLIFINLINAAIERMALEQNKYESWPLREMYENFYKELLFAYENFKPDQTVIRSANGTFYEPWDDAIKIKIKYNKKYILACSKETYWNFYQSLNEILNTNKLLFYGDADLFTNDLLTGHIGTRLDIIDYELSNSDLLIIVDLLCQTVNKTFAAYQLSDEDLILFNNFYNELTIIKNNIF